MGWRKRVRFKAWTPWVCLLCWCLWGRLAFADETVTVDTFKSLPGLQEHGIQVIEFQKVDGLYLVNGLRPNRRGDMVPVSYAVSSDLRYTFFGRVMDNRSGVGVYLRKPLTVYAERATFSQGEGSEAYFIFTDIECPWCAKLEAELIRRPLPDAVTLYYFLYPLQKTENGIAKSYFVLSQGQTERLDVMRRIMLDGDDNYLERDFQDNEQRSFDSQIIQVSEIAKELSVRGTPTIFDEEGNRYSYKQLLAKLWSEKLWSDKVWNGSEE